MLKTGESSTLFILAARINMESIIAFAVSNIFSGLKINK